ncbi:hypothetical protein EYC80_004776 [Monilinia laxa]|nr:hypothetical protein EYC80_004776 [Monilinia laxa]
MTYDPIHHPHIQPSTQIPHLNNPSAHPPLQKRSPTTEPQTRNSNNISITEWKRGEEMINAAGAVDPTADKKEYPEYL